MKTKSIGIISISGGLLFLALIPILFALASSLATQLPTAPQDKINVSASEVYERLDRSMFPDIEVGSADILVKIANPSSSFSSIAPFNELGSLIENPSRSFLFWSFLLASISIFIISIFLLKKRPRFIVLKQLLIIASLCLSSLPVIIYSLRPTWDEAFAFVSQAENFAKIGIWGISTTGNHAFSESSADWFMTIVAGLFMKILPFLSGETAVVAAILSLQFVMACFTTLVISRLPNVSPIGASFFVGTLFFFFPQTLLTGAAVLPTAVAAQGLVVLTSSLFASILTNRISFFIWGGLLAILARWEYGLLVALSTLIIILSFYLSNGRKIHPKVLVFSLVPSFFFGILELIRLSLFGTLVPAGAAYKNQGVDGAYVSSGIDYLSRTVQVNFWPLVVSFGIILSLLIIRERKLKFTFIVVAIVGLIPLSNSVIAGGDWFDIAYARYTIPTLLSLIVLTFITINSQQISNSKRETFSWLLVGIVIFSQLPSAKVVADNVDPGPVYGRVNCLAEGGEILKNHVPPQSGVATAEINTVGYFSGQPLTDLSGLVDARVASQPLTPMSAGDPHHRKTLTSILSDDKPGAIYLYEGSDCTGQQSEDTEAWNLLINRDITRFRAETPQFLLENYQPVSFYTSDEHVHRYLIRRDIANGFE